MRNEFEVGDLVSKKLSYSGQDGKTYTGIVLEIIEHEHLAYQQAPMYKIMWDYGEWMYEIEGRLKIEVRARSV
jgi:hypothetical protein|tara:strand:+ start:195 stop:413 length:219 start_codon:yes stop_codon:yes gene_type:complete